MLFFEEQERARKKTKWLVLSFFLALVAVVLVLVGGIELLFKFGEPKIAPEVYATLTPGQLDEFDSKVDVHNKIKNVAQLFAILSASLTILSCAIYQIIVLKKGGGAKVAKMVGARKIEGKTSNRLERRYLNVVEEMAIASGIPVPSCYILDKEASINAFAAGWGLEDSIICVNQGTLNYLNRDELQGVIAHEVSHIVNSDMKINIRAIALIFGLSGLMIIGKYLIELASEIKWSKDKANVILFLFGCGLIFVAAGFVGYIAGNLISAAISRQREFLADAAAVQFTRNPDGIGGALRKIKSLMLSGSGYMRGAKTLSVSHMCLSPTTKKMSENLWATHPALEDRIIRIYGGKRMGGLPLESEELKMANAVDELIHEERTSNSSLLSSGFMPSISLVPKGDDNNQQGSARLRENNTLGNEPYSVHSQAQKVMTFIGKDLILAAESSRESICLVLALMRKLNDEEQKNRIDALIKDHWQELGVEQIKKLEELILKVPEPLHLALVDLSMPSLLSLNKDGKTKLHELLIKIAKIDGKIRVYEMALLEIVDRKLIKTGFELSKNKKGRIADHKDSVMKVIAWVAKMSWGEKAKEVLESKSKDPIKGNILVEVDWGKTLKEPMFHKDLRALEELAIMQRPLVIKALLSILNKENVQSLDALRLCCTIMNVPLPLSGLDII